MMKNKEETEDVMSQTLEEEENGGDVEHDAKTENNLN